MDILFFDTSQGVTSICASKGGVVQPLFHDAQPSRQAELLVSQIADYVANCAIKWSDFAVIGCVNGIGGFTSVRIGVAAARGLAMAAGGRAVGVELMKLMAYHYFSLHNSPNVQCVIPAGNAYVAVQQFGQQFGNVQHSIELFERQDFIASQHVCVLPSLSEHGRAIFPLEQCAKIAVEMLLAQGIEGLLAPVPLYARPPDAKIGTPLLKQN